MLVIGVIVAAVLWWRHREHRPPAASGSTAATATATTKGHPTTDRRDPRATTGTIAGHVRDAAGAAIAGALVHVDALGFEPRTAATDADGGYAFPGLPVDRYHVAVAAAGFVPQVRAEVAVTAGATTTVDVALAPGGQLVTGTVSDASGGAVEGATVTATPRGTTGTAWVTAATVTDRDGHYRLGVAAGAYQIEAARDDYLPDSTSVTVADAPVTADLRLVPAGVIEGVVKDVATGAPVEGAEVSGGSTTAAWFAAGLAGYPRTTDADGRFRLVGMAPGVVRVTAQVADGRQSSDPVEVPLAIGETVSGVEVWIEARPYIAGRVVDAAGAPIAEANVMAMSARWGQSAKTDAAGQFRIVGLDPETYRLSTQEPHHQGGTPLTVTLGATPVTDVTLTMTAAARIRGRIQPPTAARILLDLGRPPSRMGGVVIDLDDVTADDTGTFELSPVTPGAHEVTARAADGRRGTATVDVAAGGTAEVVIALAARGSIAGTVRDEAGAAVSGATVVITPTGPGRGGMIVDGVDRAADRAATGRDGAFAMQGLAAGGYRLTVLDDHGGAVRLAGGKPTLVTLAADEQRRGVVLTVERDAGVIRGVVEDASGAPQADAWVSAIYGFENFQPSADDGAQSFVFTSDGSGGRAPVLTDAQGRFEFTGLKRGSYDLVAEADRGARRGRAARVATGSTVEITLGGLGALTGVVKDAAGAPVADFGLELDGVTRQHRRVRSADGHFRCDRLEPGTYTIEVHGAAGRGSAHATITAGGTAEVTIAVAAEVPVRGRLVDGAGKPYTDVSVLAMATAGGDAPAFTRSGAPMPVDAAGRFELRLPPGSYALLVLGSGPMGGPQPPFTVVAGTPLDLGDVVIRDDAPPPPPAP